MKRSLQGRLRGGGKRTKKAKVASFEKGERRSNIEQIVTAIVAISMIGLCLIMCARIRPSAPKDAKSLVERYGPPVDTVSDGKDGSVYRYFTRGGKNSPPGYRLYYVNKDGKVYAAY